MTYRFVALALVLGGCAGAATRPAAHAPSALVIVPIASASAPSPSTDPPPALRLVSKPDALNGPSCEVVDTQTSRVVFDASSKDTAAGGSEVECLDFTSGGKVIRFHNSRGIYAKDARPGPDHDQALPCGAGVFADDVTSCVKTDTSPFAYVGIGDAPAPFDIAICDVEKVALASRKGVNDAKLCNTLVTVPRGLNRFPSTPPGPNQGASPTPPSWDARYCANDRVVVVANGELALFAAPSGKLLSKVPAPGQTRITRCEGDTVETTEPKGASPRRYRLGPSSLSALQRVSPS